MSRADLVHPTPAPGRNPDVPGTHAAGRPARGWFLLLVTLLALLAILRTRFDWVMVVGASMEPTFHSGDILLVHRGAFDERDPMRGEIVVARFRNERIVKRIVGLPGETVEVRSGEVRVNAAPLAEPHPIAPGDLRVQPGRLLDGRFALLGDNRAEPEAMLFYAVVPREQVVGQVIGSLRLHPGQILAHHLIASSGDASYLQPTAHGHTRPHSHPPRHPPARVLHPVRPDPRLPRCRGRHRLPLEEGRTGRGPRDC